MCIFTQNFDRGKLVLGLGSPRGSWAGAGLAVSAVALAALHFAVGSAAGPGRTQRRTKQLWTASKCSYMPSGAGPGLNWPAGCLPMQAGPRPNKSPARQGSSGTPAWHTPRQRRSSPRQQRRYQSRQRHNRKPASRYLQQQEDKTHRGLSLNNFVSVDTGNANQESTEVHMRD